MKNLPKNIEKFLYDETQDLDISIAKSFLKYLQFHEGKSLGWCESEYLHEYEDKIYHRFIKNITENKLIKKEIKELSLELMKIKEFVDNFGRDYDCM